MRKDMQHQIADCFIDLVSTSLNQSKGVSVTSIVDTLHIDRKTFYNHFGNTTDLVIWIYRDALQKMLLGSDFFGSEFVYPSPSLNDKFPEMPFYARIRGANGTLNQRAYYKGIGKIFQSKREYYQRIFSYSCYIDFFSYMIALYLPAIRDDIVLLLGPDRTMPKVAIDFLAEYHTMGIFGRLSYHYSETKRFMMQDELDPFWNYAHETISRTIDSMFEESTPPRCLYSIGRKNSSTRISILD